VFYRGNECRIRELRAERDALKVKVKKLEAKERLRCGQFLHRTMDELTELLGVPVEKIHSRVEQLVEERDELMGQ
jgi:hypothetical protein